MKKCMVILIIGIILSGCTQIVTAPIKIAGVVVSTTIDIAGSTAHAVAGSDEEEKDD